MSDPLLLSRLSITGKITVDTPLDVVLEIADSHNIDYSDLEGSVGLNTLINEINSEDVPSVHKTLTIEDYQNIAIFVNSKINWTIGSLEVAYKFLKSFRKSEQFLNLRNDFSYGPQTPSNPRSINESVVYGACKYYGISLAQGTSEEEMVRNLRTFLSDPNSLIGCITKKLSEMKLEDIFNYLIVLNKPSKLKIKKEPIGSQVHHDYKDRRENQKTQKTQEYKGFDSLNVKDLSTIAETLIIYYPNTQSISDYIIDDYAKAIVVSQLYYDIDISSCKDPIKELVSVKGMTTTSSRKTKFNPKFPYKMYNKNRLEELITCEGYTSSEIIEMELVDLYDHLQIIALSETFHHGCRDPIKNKETPIDLLDVNSLSKDECISFGYNEFTVLTYKELYDFYNNSKQLINPVSTSKEKLSQLSVKKLLYLCRNKDDLRSLLSSMLDSEKNTVIEDILSSINEDTIGTTKEVIVNFMKMLFELGVNMRGWDNQNIYPITESFELDLDKIERRVNESLDSIRLYSENFPQCAQITKLRLVKYQHGSYILSSEDDGFTIQDRINIIKQNNTIYACIRMSSNWILSSVYKYNLALGIPNVFDIKHLRHLH